MLTRHHAFSIPVQGTLIGDNCGVYPVPVASLQGNATLLLSGGQNISPKTASAVEVTHTERRFCTTVTEEPPWPTYF